MIGISRKAEYALRAILHLARMQNGHGPVHLDTIAAKQKIPREFLVQVMSLLTKSGVVASHRGAKGGYVLLPLSHQLQVKTVVEIVDGSIGEFRCDTRGFQQCLGPSDCAFRPVWQGITRAVSRELDEITFADLCGPRFAPDNNAPPAGPA